MNFAVNYLQTNPKAKPEQLKAELRSHLQELRSNGEKISKADINRASAQSNEIFKAASEQIKANMMSKVTPKAEKAVASVNASQAAAAYPKYNDHLKADHHYFDYNAMSKKARQNRHKRTMADAKSAFAGDEYMNFLKERHPKLYEEMHTPAAPSNNQNKKAMRESADAYVSSKKRKEMKKEAEIVSQKEHKQRVLRNNPKDKTIRKARANGKYCTSQGIQTKEAKRWFNPVNKQLDGSISVKINDEPNSVLKAMKEFYSNLEAKAASHNTPSVSKPVSSASPVTTAVSNASDAVKDAAKDAAKNIKSGKSGGRAGWIAAGVVGLASALGLMMSGSKEEKNDFNEAA